MTWPSANPDGTNINDIESPKSSVFLAKACVYHIVRKKTPAWDVWQNLWLRHDKSLQKLGIWCFSRYMKYMKYIWFPYSHDSGKQCLPVLSKSDVQIGLLYNKMIQHVASLNHGHFTHQINTPNRVLHRSTGCLSFAARSTALETAASISKGWPNVDDMVAFHILITFPLAKKKEEWLETTNLIIFQVFQSSILGSMILCRAIPTYRGGGCVVKKASFQKKR